LNLLVARLIIRQIRENRGAVSVTLRGSIRIFQHRNDPPQQGCGEQEWVVSKVLGQCGEPLGSSIPVFPFKIPRESVCSPVLNDSSVDEILISAGEVGQGTQRGLVAVVGMLDGLGVVVAVLYGHHHAATWRE